jgi:hypothetical protein
MVEKKTIIAKISGLRRNMAGTKPTKGQHKIAMHWMQLSEDKPEVVALQTNFDRAITVSRKCLSHVSTLFETIQTLLTFFTWCIVA